MEDENIDFSPEDVAASKASSLTPITVSPVVNPALAREEIFQSMSATFTESAPRGYVGSHRDTGEETLLNIRSENPIVFLVIETVEGLGDSVLAASMSFKAAVSYSQAFAEPIEGKVIPEPSYLSEFNGSVRLRRPDGTATAYRVDSLTLT